MSKYLSSSTLIKGNEKNHQHASKQLNQNHVILNAMIRGFFLTNIHGIHSHRKKKKSMGDRTSPCKNPMLLVKFSDYILAG